MARLASGLIPKSSAMKNTSLPFMFDVDSAAMFGSTQFLITRDDDPVQEALNHHEVALDVGRAGVDVIARRHQLEVRINLFEWQLVLQFRADFLVQLLDAAREDVARARGAREGLFRAAGQQ